MKTDRQRERGRERGKRVESDCAYLIILSQFNLGPLLDKFIVQWRRTNWN